MPLNVNIIQGTDQAYPPSDVNVVIDVIRAFTVTQLAFDRGAREILLVNSVDEAFTLRSQNPGYLLAGEVDGLPIVGFDLDNSPHTFSQAELAGRSLVQKTTNGVKATLLALSAKVVLVTGLSNARTTALHVKKIAESQPTCRVNVIASHPSYDDDLACAEYIRDHLLGLNTISLAEVQHRINTSTPAKKFFDPEQPQFNHKDMPFCVAEVLCGFVMQVDTSSPRPRIVKVTV